MKLMLRVSSLVLFLFHCFDRASTSEFSLVAWHAWGLVFSFGTRLGGFGRKASSNPVTAPSDQLAFRVD